MAVASKLRALLVVGAVVATALVGSSGPAAGEDPEYGFAEPIEFSEPKPDDWLPTGPSTRVLGGVDAEDGQYPWMAFLRIFKGDRTFTCGGSVISDRFVLTAAHCVDGATAAQVFVGDADRPSVGGSDPRWIDAVSAAVWVTYQDFGVDDVAIVEVGTPLGVDPIPLATSAEPELDAPGRLAAVAGWGITRQSGGPIPVTLQRTYVPVRTQAECEANYSDPGATYVHAYNVCAGFMDGEGSPPTGACQGDSGSPLMSHAAHGMSQIGIVSWGNGPCTDLDDRGVYMRTSYYHDAIAAYLQGEGASLPAPPSTPTCDGKAATLAGTPGDDTIVGTPGPDVIVARSGADTVRSLGGDDVICANSGNDDVTAGTGADTVFGQSGNDTVDGNRGLDVLHGNKGRDTLRGHGGADRIHGGSGPDTILGGGGEDVLHGNKGADTVKGGNSADRIFGEEHDDSLFGGGGNDVLRGGPGVDFCKGGPGNDTGVSCRIRVSIP